MRKPVDINAMHRQAIPRLNSCCWGARAEAMGLDAGRFNGTPTGAGVGLEDQPPWPRHGEDELEPYQ